MRGAKSLEDCFYICVRFYNEYLDIKNDLNIDDSTLKYRLSNKEFVDNWFDTTKDSILAQPEKERRKLYRILIECLANRKDYPKDLFKKVTEMDHLFTDEFYAVASDRDKTNGGSVKDKINIWFNALCTKGHADKKINVLRDIFRYLKRTRDKEVGEFFKNYINNISKEERAEYLAGIDEDSIKNLKDLCYEVTKQEPINWDLYR